MKSILAIRKTVLKISQLNNIKNGFSFDLNQGPTLDFVISVPFLFFRMTSKISPPNVIRESWPLHIQRSDFTTSGKKIENSKGFLNVTKKNLLPYAFTNYYLSLYEL